MAGVEAVSAAAKSIENLLNTRLEATAVLVRTQDFETGEPNGLIGPSTLSIFLYRVDFNKTMRAAWSGLGSVEDRFHLPLDLHFLLTAWAENAEAEYSILGNAMQVLEATPIISGPLLVPAGQWAPNESLQVVLEDVTTDELMRMFDSLPADFRLSIPYLARVVRIDGSSLPTPTVTSVLVSSGGAG